MVLYAHRADRSDRLVDALAEVMADPLPDVMATEVVAVPARGIERWITQQLSHRLGAVRSADGVTTEAGVCAGVRFTSPARLIAEVVGGSDDDPWAPERLVWPLLAAIDEAMGAPWAATLSRHLGFDRDQPDPQRRVDRRGRRYAVARRLAGLFDTYAGYRPELIADWAAGGDGDGVGGRVPDDLAWQPRLWRATRDRIDGPDPARRSAEALATLRTAPEAVDLPTRLSVFGPTRLRPAQLAVLHALAEARDVHLWLPQPSVSSGSAILAQRSMGSAGGIGAGGPPSAGRRTLRADDRTAATARHPLLASLGRESRELLLGLPADTVDDPLEREHRPDTVLHRLQADIAADRRPTAEQPDPDDRSVQIHACHGPARQVEVLRDVVVGLLADDPTLEPRDVLVMCPDIDEYAPLIAADFGMTDVVAEPDKGHPGHRLRVRLADRALRRTNPLVAVAFRLMDLARGRVPASEVLDLAASFPVRRRFRFSDGDLETIGTWVADAGVRWGLDAAHRAPYGLEELSQNTWKAGLDRILLGVAMADTDGNFLGLAAPLDDVGSSDIDLAGRLAEFVDLLRAAVDALTVVRPLADWLPEIRDAVDALTDLAPSEAWQRTELHRQLADTAVDAGERGGDLPLAPSDALALLQDRLAARPTRSNFRTGTLTVCTMVPMRSVPHRVICLLGIDDGAFPRGAGVDGDDLLARNPVVGERDPRSQDRQLLLDAIMAAGERLVITYGGADPRSGATRPPSVPLGELMSVLEESTGAPLDMPHLVRHPLQPYDIHTVLAGRLGVPGPFTFDRAALAGALAATAPRTPAAPFLTAPLPARPARDVALDDLIRFLQKPARGFLRERLGVTTLDESQGPGDEMLAGLDHLQQWKVGDRLLARRLAGVEFATATEVEWRRGDLPPGKLGATMLKTMGDSLEPVVSAALALRDVRARSVDVLVDLPDGTVLSGTVPDVYGDRVVAAGYSKLGPSGRLQAWIRVLALAAARPGIGWQASTVGRQPTGVGARVSELTAPDRAIAAQLLFRLVQLYRIGLRTPLPLPCKTSEAYAAAIQVRAVPDRAADEAERKWASGKYPAEDAEPAHQLVWGGLLPFAGLLAQPAPADVELAGVDLVVEGLNRGSWFATLACLVWLPLLDGERVGAP